MITSATPKEEKSFIAANFGISLAQGMDQYSLLVDCDLRRPSLAGLIGINSNVGLVDYLKDKMKLPDLISKTDLEKLSVLPSGKPPVNPAELLSLIRMRDLVEELSKRYEDRIIIFDTPPTLVAAEASVLAGQVDAVLLAVRQGGAGKAEIKKFINLIGTARIIGIVFNITITIVRNSHNTAKKRTCSSLFQLCARARLPENELFRLKRRSAIPIVFRFSGRFLLIFDICRG